jgi:hypothetical protein
LPEDRLPVFQARLPERSPLMEHRVLAGDAVREHVEAALLAVDAFEERPYVGFHCVVDTDRDRPAARREDDLDRFVDGFRPFVRGRVAAHAPSGAVDDRARLGQSACDAPPCAPRRTCDDRNLSGQNRCHAPGAPRHADRL